MGTITISSTVEVLVARTEPSETFDSLHSTHGSPAALGIDTDDADGRVDALQPLALCFWAAGGGAPLLGQLRGAV